MSNLTTKKPLPAGVYPDLSNDDYHAQDAVSKSGLDKVAESLPHYWYSRQGSHTPTLAMIEGAYFHDLTLMGEAWCKKNYLIRPTVDRRSSLGKAEHTQFDEMVKDLPFSIIEPDTYDLCHAMRDSVMMNEHAAWMIDNGTAEQSHFWVDKETGVNCRARPDTAIKEDKIIADLKSTADVSIRGFAKSVHEYRYHVQEAMYKDGYEQSTGVNIDAFYFIATEKKAVNPVTAIYQLSPRTAFRGQELYRRDMNTIKQALDNPRLFTQSIEIEIPDYGFREN